MLNCRELTLETPASLYSHLINILLILSLFYKFHKSEVIPNK